MFAGASVESMNLWRGLHDDLERWLSVSAYQPDGNHCWVLSIDMPRRTG